MGDSHPHMASFLQETFESASWNQDLFACRVLVHHRFTPPRISTTQPRLHRTSACCRINPPTLETSDYYTNIECCTQYNMWFFFSMMAPYGFISVLLASNPEQHCDHGNH